MRFGLATLLMLRWIITFVVMWASLGRSSVFLRSMTLIIFTMLLLSTVDGTARIIMRTYG